MKRRMYYAERHAFHALPWWRKPVAWILWRWRVRG